MICFLYLLSDIAQQTFKTCFSPRSYLRGNTLTNELTMHLIPFDHIDQINDYNQCKTALDKMNVLIYLHFDTVSFPRPADPKVYFRYQFNTPIDVVFPLSDADYNSILDKPTAVFELRYDISYVIVNGSVSIVEHTKYNGTGCFADIQMVYDMYGDIDILTTPNNCYVDFAAGVTVSFEYTYKSQNKQIPIYSCTSGCVEGEYNATSLIFQDITTYRVKKTPGLATKFADFYTAFADNRLIKTSLNIKFNTNGVQQTIKQFIDNKAATDTLGCIANDPQTPTYFGLSLYTLVNPDGLIVQIRDVLTNKMNCDTGTASTVKLDHYMIEGTNVDRRQLSVEINEYNEMIGLKVEPDTQYIEFRQQMSTNTKSLIVLSFEDANGNIVYEICTYGQAFIGCFKQQALHIYKDKQCLRVTFDTLLNTLTMQTEIPLPSTTKMDFHTKPLDNTIYTWPWITRNTRKKFVSHVQNLILHKFMLKTPALKIKRNFQRKRPLKISSWYIQAIMNKYSAITQFLNIRMYGYRLSSLQLFQLQQLHQPLYQYIITGQSELLQYNISQYSISFK
ncbi:Conserved_hypothetical protein [Hexamita inflata]|uniref:Uncharacterized protein n=1 Tax=Hexamita inflata TaxID=28002 RepID=A0AA86P6B0_9EUKA|nr:Conserved hypothetical protein [Hexamita inflata]